MPGVLKRASIMCLAALVAAAGCSKPDAPRTPARVRVLNIGLTPEQSLFRQIERYQPVMDYVSERVDARLRLRVMPSYARVVDGIHSNELDGAFVGSFAYLMCRWAANIEPLARPEAPDGRSTYHGVIIVRKNGGVTGAKDLAGRRFAFVDKTTTAGYLLPLEFLTRAGVADYRTFLGEFYFAGTHEDVIRDVVDGKADAGGVKNTVLERLVAADPRIGESLTILARSPEVPESTLILKEDVDASLARKIKQTLLRMHEDPEGRSVLQAFGARRFVESRDAEYEPVFRYAKEVGLDLAQAHGGENRP